MKRPILVIAGVLASIVIIYAVVTNVGGAGRPDLVEEHDLAAPDTHAEGESEHNANELSDHDDIDGEHDADDEHSAADGDEATLIELTESQIILTEIAVVTAGVGQVPMELQFSGEVTVNQDRTAHIVPRLPGIITEIHAELGDEVTSGTDMAVIDSRDLAEIKSAFVAANARAGQVYTRFVREESLRDQGITSEQDFLEARGALTEARIERRALEQQLQALGFDETQLEQLISNPQESFTEYHIIAPFDGTVIEKHVTDGEFVEEMEPLYVISDLQIVWVMASVYEQDIPNVRMDQSATVRVGAYPEHSFSGMVSWIADTLDEQTRTLMFRVEVDNAERLLKPGMFADVALEFGSDDGILVIPIEAIQRQRDETIVFVDIGQGQFERREVTVGLRSPTVAEIRDGIEVGERIVTTGSFLLKSELEKEGFSSGHGGH